MFVLYNYCTHALAERAGYLFKKYKKNGVVFSLPNTSKHQRKPVFRIFNFSSRHKYQPVNLGVFMIRETVSFKLHTFPFSHDR